MAVFTLFTSQLPIYRDRDCSAWLLVLGWAILGSKPDRGQRVSSSKCPDRLWCSPIGYRQLSPGLKRRTRDPDPSPAYIYIYIYIYMSGMPALPWISSWPVEGQLHHELHIFLLGAFARLRKATVRFVISVRPSTWNNSAASGRVFIKFDMCVFFENPSRIFKCH